MRIVAGRLDSCDKWTPRSRELALHDEARLRRHSGTLLSATALNASSAQRPLTSEGRETAQTARATARSSSPGGLLGVVDEVEPPPAACADQNVRL